MTLRLPSLAAGAAMVVVLGACGKKGPPQAPFRPDPARIADVAARAVDARVEFTVTLPAANADGTTPSIIERVELYVVVVPAPPDPVEPPVAAMPVDPAPPAPPPVPAAAIAQPDHLIATIDVVSPEGRPVGEQPTEPGRLTISHDLSDIMAAVTPGERAPSLRYVAVGMGRGRRGPTSPVADVPLGRRPAAPASARISITEATTTVAWDAASEGLAAHVDEVVAGAGGVHRIRRTTAPVAGLEFGMPVVFDAPICLEVRHVVVAGRASVEGPSAPVVCATPADRFAPPAPTALVAIAENGAVLLTWRGVSAADLAGYLVLRGEGAGETLQPLTLRPVAQRSYRDDTARPGLTYTYAVVAVDQAGPANRSAESNRQVVTAR